MARRSVEAGGWGARTDPGSEASHRLLVTKGELRPLTARQQRQLAKKAAKKAAKKRAR